MEHPWLIVAVCTNRVAGKVDPTLRALAAQLPEVPGSAGLVLASGRSPGARELERLAGERGLRFASADDPGLSVARNAALAAAGVAEVIAFIDDDAIPEPGWLARLAAHWSEAPADLACIGGAIDPLWAEPPPRWMGERVHIVFSLLDRGEGVRALRPGVEDAWGANVSFRVAALRGVGGFDTALGVTGDIPFFAEETEAQLRLAQAGFRGIYAGDVRVGHVVAGERMRLREVFRRRFYAGASMRTIGQWSPAAGLARLGAGLVEIPVAAVRRRPPDLAGAIARVGAGAGVLAEPLVRRNLSRRRREGR